MKSFLFSTLSLVVCCVLLFGSTECATIIAPSPTGSQPNNTMASLMTKDLSNSTAAPINSTVPVTHSPKMSSAYTTSMPNMTTVSHVFPNHTSIIGSSSHLVNFSVHHSSIFMNMSSTVSSIVMSSSAGNASIHNSTILPTPSPTSVSNMSSTIIHNGSRASSHILPTMTLAPTPVTSVVPTSTVLPTTPPPAPKGKFNVKKNGTVCLIIWLSLKFTIHYKNSSGNELQTNVVMPSTGTPNGLCEQSLSSILISWPHYSFEAYFHTAVKGSNGRWNTINVTVTAQTVNNTDFINPNEKTIKHSVTSQSQLEWLSGKVGRSLNCSEKKSLESKDKKMTASIEELRIQPFKVEKNTFGQADSCKSPTSKPSSKPTTKKSNNTVAIAVGCSLAGLVLIVLIGYFIGKRRSRPGTGYRKL